MSASLPPDLSFLSFASRGDVDQLHGVQGVARLGHAGLIVDHLFGVAVIGRDEHVSIEFEQATHELAHALVDDLDRLPGGVEVARVADHVAVRVVDGDEGVGIGFQILEKLVGDDVRLHFRVAGEGGGIEASGYLHLVLVFKRRRGLAVEEAGHVAELLRLGDAQLLQPGMRDHLAQQVLHAAAFVHWAHDVLGQLIVVAGESHIDDLRPGL